MKDTATARSVNEEALLKEYYEILKLVGEFDGRLMTVKGWGVTLSLAALAWGFQYGHYGLFLVAALGGLGFWLIEGAMKRHQTRYYLRMREIEVLQYQRVAEEDAKAFSSPRIDSSWSHAGELYNGKEQCRVSPRSRSWSVEVISPRLVLSTCLPATCCQRSRRADTSSPRDAGLAG